MSDSAPTAYRLAREQLRERRHHWLVTGVAGFIGSNLLQTLLELDQRVTGLDSFLTGYQHNLDQVREHVGAARWRNFRMIEGDIRAMNTCQAACTEVDFVLHQAALGSVSRSIAEPVLASEINVAGFLNMLTAARDAHVKRFVYAASSATYGDHPDLPKVEQHIGRPLSPYAVTKYVNEVYADVYGACYGTESIGLRYFNVFGPRQDPHGAYAAVIPQWIAAMMGGQPLYINGDGETSRDFCYVDNAVQANVLAALAREPAAINQVYNVAVNARTSLNGLYALMHELLVGHYPHLRNYRPSYTRFRDGDIRHSQADIGKARRLLGYAPTHRLQDGMQQALAWYMHHLK